MTGAGIDPTLPALLGAMPAVLRALLLLLPESELTGARDGDWGVGDVVAHLLDAEGIAFRERIARMAAEDRPYLRSIDPEARIAAAGLRGRSIAELLDAFGAAREAAVAALEALPAEALDREGEHDVAGRITPRDVAHQWAYHDLQHLRQIAAMLQAPLPDRMGNTRRFYDV